MRGIIANFKNQRVDISPNENVNPTKIEVQGSSLPKKL
jgi:hypothetical protein